MKNELAFKASHEWIPVDKELPFVPEDHSDSSEYVIVAAIHQDGEVIEWDKAYLTAFGNEWYQDNEKLPYNPTHWKYVR